MTHKIRKMTYDDLDRVIEIEEAAHVSPWSRGIFRDCIGVGYYCDVVEKRRHVLGFSIASMQAAECHLLNICVAPRAQGHGLGKKLLDNLIDRAKSLCGIIYLEVRPTNEAALHIYEQYGFKQIGERKNYYQNPDGTKEHAYVLALAL